MRVTAFVAAMMVASAAWALEPAEVAVIYNADFEGSKDLAEYYAAKRGVPRGNLLAIRASREEGVSRPVYVETIEKPVRAWLDAGDRRRKIRCLLMMRGVPVSIDEIDDPKTRKVRDEAAAAMNRVAAEKTPLEAEKKRLQEEAKQGRIAAAELARQIAGIDATLAEIETRRKPLQDAYDRAYKAWRTVVGDTNAAVDSELAVMYFSDNPGQRWLPNVLMWKTWTAAGRERMPKTIMTCRLDGPTDALVKRIIDDSIATEAVGLQGVAYFDAWNKHPGGSDPRASIVAFDELIRRAARRVEKAGVKAVLDDRDAVFETGTCPNAALYCGWYSLERYVPAFQWVRGSVGYHVASFEARSLRNPKTQDWCKRMIEEGVAATFGAVSEPFIHAFPDPSHFFAFLLTGRYTMVEVYWYTAPVDSWMLTLVADPLYTPFKKNPKMTLAEMREALGMTPPAPKPAEPAPAK